MSTQLLPGLNEPYRRRLLSELFKNGRAALDDKNWREIFAQMTRSQTLFILADLVADQHLIERAGDVIIYREGRFSPVRELVAACASHKWNGTIYEAWAWETAQRIRTLLRSLDAIGARALKLYAQHSHYYEVDTGAMREAILEAKIALEGELSWEAG